MFPRTRTAVVLLLAAVLSGCVYFNTFYNAQEAYRDAELLREQRPPDSVPSALEIELLDRAIEKSRKVIRLHSGTKWADDAHLLLGKSLHHQRKHEAAEESLRELLTLYPDSELVAEAEYVLAAVLIAKKNPVSAEELLAHVAFADPPVPLSDDALMLIGDARNSRGRYAEAAEAYLAALDRFPGSEIRGLTRYLAAENYATMGEWELAAEHFRRVPGESPTAQIAFESRMRLAETDLELGATDEAIGVLRDLERRTTDPEDLDRVLLLKGRAYEVVGDLEEAIDTYEATAAGRARSDAASEALYRIGLIQRDRLDDYDEAIEYFQRAKDESPRSDSAGLASRAARDIREIRGYIAKIEKWEASASSDSIPARRERPPVTPFELPEVPDSLSVVAPPAAVAPDSAAVTPDSVAVAPETAVVAEDSAAVTLDSAAVAPERAAVAPDSAATAGGPPAEIITARFLLAESYLFRFNAPRRALEAYRVVAEEHAESDLGPKAALAIGWIYEHRLDDVPAAISAYRAVVDRHPGTLYAEKAAAALSALDPSATEPKGEGAAGVAP